MSLNPSKISRCRTGGFTLVEVLCAMSILALLMVGVFSLYVAELRMESRTQSDASGGGSGTNAIRQISECARESLYYLLPQETLVGNNVSFTTQLATIAASGNNAYPSNPATRFANYTPSNFMNTNANGAVCYTGVFFAYPPVVSPINIVTSQGVAPATPVRPYNQGGTSTSYVLFYRSDYQGNPQPATGKCVWETGTVNGVTVDRAAIRSLDNYAWNAVEFERPVNAQTGVVVWNEVQAKVVCGSYSLQSGVQSNESTDGTNASAVVGKTILLRDFDPTGNSNLNSNTPTNTVSTRFQSS